MNKLLVEIISSLRTHDLKGDAVTFSMQAGAMLLNLLTNLLLTNIMLPDEYGAFAYSTTLIFVLAGIGTFGTQNLLVREASAGLASGNSAVGKNLWSWSIRRSGIFSIALTVVFIVAAFQFSFFFREANLTGFSTPMLISLLAVPLLVAIYINQSYLQGLRRIFAALFAEKIVKPLLLITMVTVCLLVSENKSISFMTVAYINVASFLAALVIILVSISRANKNIDAPAIEINIAEQWKRSSWTFFLFSVATLLYLRADIICLGFFQNPEQIGVYNISARIADTISFPLHILTFGLSPLISGLYHSGDKMKLQQTVTSSTRAIFILSAIPAILILFFGIPVLRIFGSHFENGYSSLVILTCANFLNALAGPAGYVLAMTGHERLAFLSMTLACMVNIAMNFVLIPLYGINGAALAVACAIITWNILIAVYTVKKTGVRSDIFYFIRRK
jgi:O-antigen/teichoic acid export membrane protein